MAYKYLKYFIILLACWCCTTAVSAQTGSSVDSTEVDSTGVLADSSENTGTQDSENNSKSAADKFALRQPQGTVAERKLPASSVDEIKKDKDFWYRDKQAGKEKQEEEKQSTFEKVTSSPLFTVIFWAIVIAAFVGIIVIYLMNSKVWLFSPRSRKIHSSDLPKAVLDDNIFTMDFDARINQALAEFNYRLATRLMFLRLLRTMSEKNIIQYGIDKTNMDYMFELGNTRYFKDFAQASRTYEYVWYGNFDVHKNQFSSIKERLDEFNQKLNT